MRTRARGISTARRRDLVCNRIRGHCVACNSAADCADGPCIGHSCVYGRTCESSLECADLRVVCAPALPRAWPSNGVGKGCAECANARDCNDTETCEEGLCVDVCERQGLNCGDANGASCGECPGEAQCAPDGRSCLTTISLGFFWIESMLSHENHLFLWVDGRNGTPGIWRLDLEGDEQPRRVLMTGSGYLDGVAVAGKKLFAARTDGTLQSGPLDGRLNKFADVPGAGPSNSAWCQSLAGHGDYAVCALVDDDARVASGLYRIPVDGTAATFFEGGVSQPAGVFVSGDEVVWSDSSRIAKTHLLTGKRTELERIQANLHLIAGGYAFYETTDGVLRRAPLAGGAPETVKTQSTYGRMRLVGASETKLYFAAGTDSIALFETALDGGEPSTVAEPGAFSSNQVVGVHVHRDRLYVVMSGDVVRMDR